MQHYPNKYDRKNARVILVCQFVCFCERLLITCIEVRRSWDVEFNRIADSTASSGVISFSECPMLDVLRANVRWILALVRLLDLASVDTYSKLKQARSKVHCSIR